MSVNDEFILNQNSFNHPIYLPYKNWIEIAIKHFQPNQTSAELFNLLINNSPNKYTNSNKQKLLFINQPKNPQILKKFRKYYERYIEEDGQIPTRDKNWHDFFNAICWLNFPNIKKTISTLHYRELIRKGFTNKEFRGSQRDFLTLFDEGGSIIAINRQEKIDFELLIKNHDWIKTFWQYREQLIADTRLIIIGHALLDKARQPFCGITAKTLFVYVDEKLLENIRKLIKYLDEHISNYLLQQDTNLNPSLLTPLPIFGYPNWDIENNKLSFYQNTEIFRPQTFRLR